MSVGESDPARDLAYYEAVPYVLVVESVERGGEWLRRAEYPELPGCAAEAPSALEAIEKLERARRRVLRQLWDRGAPIPVPRPPLRELPTDRSLIRERRWPPAAAVNRREVKKGDPP